jgi:hypothetical protein
VTADHEEDVSNRRHCTYYPPREELFSLGEDRGEEENLLAVDEAATDSMRALLRAAFEAALPPDTQSVAFTRSAGISQDLKRQLEALGYVQD